jgi:lipid A 4'-phosphatase
MSLIQTYNKARLFQRDWLFFVACVALFAAFPNLDIVVANWTWNADDQFIYEHTPWVQLSYLLFAKIHFFYLFIFLIVFLKQLLSNDLKNKITRQVIVLLIALLLGPGLVVNQLFKENWGRARPHEVTQFGGTQRYTSPLEISDQCQGNCSFVSGHASGAFFILTLSWIFGYRRWFWIGLGVGSIVGLGRILQGGHFFSDVIFSFWAVYFSSQLTATLFKIDAPTKL